MKRDTAFYGGVTIVFLISGLVLVRVGAAQRPQDGSEPMAIVGRVIAAENGEPIRNSVVTVSSPSAARVVLTTDGTGTFRFSPAVGGLYQILARKTGYVPAGTDAMAGQPIEVRLTRAGAIVGRVTDEAGEPVMGLRVAALARPRPGGEPVTAMTTTTNDRGEYRLGGLAAGPFQVSLETLVRMPTERVGRERTIYYPAAATIGDAQAISVFPGVEQRGVDFMVPAHDLTGMPAAIFANRFSLYRTERTDPRHGIVKSPAPAGLRGRVTNLGNAPMSGTQIFLFGNSTAESRAVTADGDGRFDFGRVAAGAYLLSARKEGFAQVEGGQLVALYVMKFGSTFPNPQDTPFGRRIDLEPGGEEHVELRMAPLSTVSGVVRDEYGDPVGGIPVELLQQQYRDARRRLVSVGSPEITDDLGRYRFYGLSPDQYIVAATPSQGAPDDLPGYGRTYFPGTVRLGEAAYVPVGLAQDVDGIDFSVERVSTARVTGTVQAGDGARVPSVHLTTKLSERSSPLMIAAVTSHLMADGTFEFLNVPPGQYVIQAYEGQVNPHVLGAFGAVLVSVNGVDVSGVTIPLSRGSSVTGRVVFDVASDRATFSRDAVDLVATVTDFDLAPSDRVSADVHPDWTFEIRGLTGPRRLQVLHTPPGLALEAIRVNGMDITDTPVMFGATSEALSDVEVILTDRVGSVSGRVVDDRLRPSVGTTVTAFSTNRQHWYPASRYLRTSTTDANGTFAIAGLAPGVYYLVASPFGVRRVGINTNLYLRHLSPLDDAWQDPDALESLIPAASTVPVAEGQQATQTLRVSSR